MPPHGNSDNVHNGDSLSALGRYCLCLIDFISSQATDPHLYFQHKLTADISAAKNLTVLMDLLDYLIDWIDSADLQSIQMTKLDDILAVQELPSFSLMRIPANRNLGRILATGQVATEQEYCLVRNTIFEAPEVSGSDRILGERLVMAYESGE